MAKTAIRLESEWSDKPDYTSVKIVDPDGYVVEIASDASLYGVIAYRVDRANWLPTFPQNLTVVICETRSPVYSYPTIGHRSVVGADDCGDETRLSPRRILRTMTQQALHQHSYTIPLEWESRVPIVTTIRTIEVTRSHSTDKPTSWVTSATRVTVLGCECGAEFRRQMFAQ
jgi:hypothetical protein